MFVDPAGESAFGFTIGDQVIIDLRCQFWWGTSPGFMSPFSSAPEHSHTPTTCQIAFASAKGAAAVQHIRMASPPGDSLVVPVAVS